MCVDQEEHFKCGNQEEHFKCGIYILHNNPLSFPHHLFVVVLKRAVCDKYYLYYVVSDQSFFVCPTRVGSDLLASYITVRKYDKRNR